MQHVAVHLHRIVLFKHLGRWPGPALAHGLAGIEQLYRSKLKQSVHRFLEEEVALPSKNSPCPCGSKARFQRCCRNVVREGRGRLAEIRSLLARAAASRPSSPAKH
ncbi:SEC-C metal-binding domain-containing protein [Myxococcus sp. AM010]|uniref:SEC-C metal-binding domain-containing protein n=1 Tax=Myxococcus sp. AM010 TaxID=2745138 RepID=UPI0034CEE4CE